MTGGDGNSRDETGMNDFEHRGPNREGEAGLDPREARARREVQTLGPVVASPDFRAQLRESFVTGAISSSIATSGVERPAARDRVWWSPRYLLPVAAAFGLVLLGVLFMLDHGPAWTLAGTRGEGSLVVDGVVIPGTHLAEAVANDPELLRPGRSLELRGELELDLLCPRTMAVQATLGSRFELPRAPGSWLRREVRGSVSAGELRIVTGPEFEGARLTMAGPDADVTVLGTVFALICNPGATCLCVFDGEVAMTTPGGAPVVVESGSRRVVYASGDTPLLEPILPMEQMKLGMLADQMRPLLEHPSR